MIQHHGFAKSVQSEFRRVVRRASRKCILPCQAAYIDDVTAATILHASERFARAVKRSRQIRVDRLPPIFHREFRRAFHNSHARIVDQNIGTARFLVNPLKQCRNVCASSYIGSFAHHFTPALVGEAAYSIVYAGLLASADCHGSAGTGYRPRDRKANSTCCSSDNRSPADQKRFVHDPILTVRPRAGRYVYERTTRKRAC